MLYDDDPPPKSREDRATDIAHRAARRGDLRLVRVALANGGQTTQRRSDRWSLVEEAVLGRHPEAIAGLVTLGAPVQELEPQRRGTDGESAIHVAAAKGDVRCVDALIQVGASINQHARVADLNTAGWTPLHYAAVNGQRETVTGLLDRGADPTVRAADGRTAFQTAVSEHKFDAATEILRRLDRAASNPADANGRDLYAEAAEHDNSQVMDYLISNDVPLTMSTSATQQVYRANMDEQIRARDIPDDDYVCPSADTLHRAVDRGASPYVVPSLDREWFSRLVAAGPSDRLNLLAHQAVETDRRNNPFDENPRHDHLLALVTHCCRADDRHPAWRDAPRASVDAFHDAVMAAAGNYVAETGKLAYLAPIAERIDAHRSWLDARTPERDRLSSDVEAVGKMLRPLRRSGDVEAQRRQLSSRGIAVAYDVDRKTWNASRDGASVPVVDLAGAVPTAAPTNMAARKATPVRQRTMDLPGP